MKLIHFTCLLALLMAVISVAQAATPSFADFDKRAKKGERLTVVFFGASLTWGANASDPINTSYRGVLAEKFEKAYPKAHFKFYDAAIGGTGSQLGVFRLDRDVLGRRPDLVFLDFSANDDIFSDNPETLASYESIVRRIIEDGRAPVVQMIFPFKWDVDATKLESMKRRTAHYGISQAYNTGVGDAITYCIDGVKAGKYTIDQLWPYDGAHPGDLGYAQFAEAAFQGFQHAVKSKQVCKAPEKMLYADTYMRNARVRISMLGPLPEGWRVDHPSLVAAWHDGLMCRWLDDVVAASNRKVGANGKWTTTPQKVARLKARFVGSMVMLFGEETVKSTKYVVYIDGKQAGYTPWGKKEVVNSFDASAKRYGGGRQHAQIIAMGLDPTVEHTIEIEPLIVGDEDQELRLESICVAGGNAKVMPPIR